MRVLIADDDATSRKILELVLSKLGYEVHAEANGEAALNVLLGQDPPELAILDWVMPRMDGPRVCRELRDRQDGGRTYVLLLTSKSSKQDLVRGLEAGADDYLAKPFNVNELKARLQVGERFASLQRELRQARRELQRHRGHADASPRRATPLDVPTARPVFARPPPIAGAVRQRVC